jgi:hypothetical protein
MERESVLRQTVSLCGMKLSGITWITRERWNGEWDSERTTRLLESDHSRIHNGKKEDPPIGRDGKMKWREIRDLEDRKKKSPDNDLTSKGTIGERDLRREQRFSPAALRIDGARKGCPRSG